MTIHDMILQIQAGQMTAEEAARHLDDYSVSYWQATAAAQIATWQDIRRAWKAAHAPEPRPTAEQIARTDAIIEAEARQAAREVQDGPQYGGL